MTFVLDTAAKAAFKKMYGKAHTSNAKDVVNESEPSNVSLSAQTIFADTIPSTGSGAVTAGVATFVNIPLVLDSSSNGKAYKAQITGSVPAGLVGEINPLTGTTYSTGQRVGTFVPEYLGADFRIRLKDGATEIAPLASQDWVFDYYAGIVVSEDNLNLSSGSIDGYVYIGNFLNSFTSATQLWGESGSDIYNLNAGDVLITNDAFVSSRLSIGTGSLDAINAQTVVFADGDVVAQSTLAVPAVEVRGSTVSTNVEVGLLAFGNYSSTAATRRIAKISGFTSNPYDAEAGQLVFYTANISGTLNEVMRIDEDGNVGVGSASPSSLLHIRSSSSGSSRITLDYNNTSTSIGQVLGQVDWVGNDASSGAGGTRANIRGIYRGTAGATAIEFYTTTDSSATLNHVMSLDYNQRMGVGTTSPDAKLHVMSSDISVAASVETILALERSGKGFVQLLTTGENGIIFGTDTDTTSGGVRYNTASTPLGMEFRANGNSTKMYITSDGNVGIGTTSSGPQTKLHVVTASVSATTLLALDNSNTTASNGAIISFRTTTTGAGAASFQELSAIRARYTDHNHATRSSDMSMFVSTSGSITEAMTISSAANVGIGVTSPTERLEVNNGSASVDMFLARENGTPVFSLPDGMAPPSTNNKILYATTTSGAVAWDDVTMICYNRSGASFYNHEDFIGPESVDDGWGIWDTLETAGGQVGNTSEDANHPGIIYLGAAVAGDDVVVRTASSVYGPSTTQRVDMQCLVRFSNTTQTSNNWTMKFGLSTNYLSYVDGTDEVSISIDAGSNSFRAKIMSGGGTTYNSSIGVTAATGTWYKLSIIISSGVAVFAVNGTTVIGTATTPTASAMMGVLAYGKTSGATTYYCYSDYITMLVSGLTR